MQLIEAQSLSAGAEIKNIQIYEKYFPLPFDKYIVFQPWSKPSKNYDLWLEVLNIIHPVLEKNGIKIVQIGAQNERPLTGTYYIAGQTNIGQIAHIIKNSLLFFGADSFGQHLAGHYNIPLVDLISNNYKDVVQPYFGDKSKQIIIEPKRSNNEKPNFSLEENPKSINTIKPEEIAKSILKLLNLEYGWPYEQVYLGEIFISPMIISTCSHTVNPQQFGVDKMIVDMSLDFNEDVLIQQMQICNVSIITNRTLSNKVLDFHKQTKRIQEIIYKVDTNSDPHFLKTCLRYTIPFRISSELSTEQIHALKINYMDYGVIWPENIISIEKIKELEGLDLNNLYFRASKFYIGRGKLYPSKCHYLQDKPIQSFDSINSVINEPIFWQEINSIRLLKKV